MGVLMVMVGILLIPLACCFSGIPKEAAANSTISTPASTAVNEKSDSSTAGVGEVSTTADVGGPTTEIRKTTVALLLSTNPINITDTITDATPMATAALSEITTVKRQYVTTTEVNEKQKITTTQKVDVTTVSSVDGGSQNDTVGTTGPGTTTVDGVISTGAVDPYSTSDSRPSVVSTTSSPLSSGMPTIGSNTSTDKFTVGAITAKSPTATTKLTVNVTFPQDVLDTSTLSHDGATTSSTQTEDQTSTSAAMFTPGTSAMSHDGATTAFTQTEDQTSQSATMSTPVTPVGNTTVYSEKESTTYGAVVNVTVDERMSTQTSPDQSTASKMETTTSVVKKKKVPTATLR